MKFSRTLLFLPVLVFCISAKKNRQPVYDLKYVEDNMVYVPTTTFRVGDEEVDTPYQTASWIVTIDSFYLSKFEMTNGLYCFYLHALQKSDSTAYKKALPDTLVWRERLAYNEPYVEYYLRHPAYANYPVVGVSYDQAQEFCLWLTKHYNALPDHKYKNAKFDLPTKNEWMSAAMGGDQQALFPWKGYHMRNSNGETMANFMRMDESSVRRLDIPYINVYGDSAIRTIYSTDCGGDEMGIAGKLNDAADVTAPVNSYWPNSYGLFNMSGNVEEMVKEKGVSKGGSWRDPGYYLRITTEENYPDSIPASSERGFRIAMHIPSGNSVSSSK